MRTLKVRLRKDVRDMAGNSADSVHQVVFALDGIPEVVGAGYLPLSKEEWEPALTSEDLDRLLGRRQRAERPAANKGRRRGPA